MSAARDRAGHLVMWIVGIPGRLTSPNVDSIWSPTMAVVSGEAPMRAIATRRSVGWGLPTTTGCASVVATIAATIAPRAPGLRALLHRKRRVGVRRDVLGAPWIARRAER